MREYEIHPVNGIPTTIQLDDEEAERLGLKPVERKTKDEVKTKVKTPLNKSVTPKSVDAGS